MEDSREAVVVCEGGVDNVRANGGGDQPAGDREGPILQNGKICWSDA